MRLQQGAADLVDERFRRRNLKTQGFGQFGKMALNQSGFVQGGEIIGFVTCKEESQAVVYPNQPARTVIF